MDDKMSWLKELVRAEREMEESGVVDVSAGFDPETVLADQSKEFLERLKDLFIQYTSAFNQMKGVALGGVKIYGIAKTAADFMLFRNGYKLIFSLKQSGQISITFNHQGSTGFVPGAQVSEEVIDSLMNEDRIEARWGAFGQIIWTHKELEINQDHLVRYYLSRFIRESTK